MPTYAQFGQRQSGQHLSTPATGLAMHTKGLTLLGRHLRTLHLGLTGSGVPGSHWLTPVCMHQGWLPVEADRQTGAWISNQFTVNGPPRPTQTHAGALRGGDLTELTSSLVELTDSIWSHPIAASPSECGAI